MRPIAMLNQKGGVGKTTTAVNVAAALGRVGQRVLLLDLDPQSHATMHLGVEHVPGRPGIYDVLVSGTSIIGALCQVTDNLTLIPSHLDLVGAELEMGQLPDRELVLRRALEPLNDRFDTLVVDCPPSLGTLTINALAAVEDVLIPLQPHFLALQGLGRLLETVALVRGVLNPPLRIAGVILCMYEKGTRLAHEVAADVRQFISRASREDAWHGARVFKTCIRRNVKLAECPSFGQTIFDYAPGSHGAEDYAALTNELLEMLAESAEQSHVADDGSAAGTQPGAVGATTPADVRDGFVSPETLVVEQAVADVDQVAGPDSRVASAEVWRSAGEPEPSSRSAREVPETRAP